MSHDSIAYLCTRLFYWHKCLLHEKAGDRNTTFRGLLIDAKTNSPKRHQEIVQQTVRRFTNYKQKCANQTLTQQGCITHQYIASQSLPALRIGRNIPAAAGSWYPGGERGRQAISNVAVIPDCYEYFQGSIVFQLKITGDLLFVSYPKTQQEVGKPWTKHGFLNLGWCSINPFPLSRLFSFFCIGWWHNSQVKLQNLSIW